MVKIIKRTDLSLPSFSFKIDGEYYNLNNRHKYNFSLIYQVINHECQDLDWNNNADLKEVERRINLLGNDIYNN